MTSTLNRTDAQITIGEAITRLMPAGVPFRFTAYDGSTAGPAGLPDPPAPATTSAGCPTCSPPPATWAWPAPTSPAT